VIGAVSLISFGVVAIVLAAVAVAVYFATRGGGEPATAPALTAEALAALPTDSWITNGGSLSNQRYSPLDEIATANVPQLRGV
jgi:glucose dehydrogenase